MEFHDSQLVELARGVYMADMGVFYLVSQIGTMRFDQASHQAWYYSAAGGDITPILPYLGHHYEANLRLFPGWQSEENEWVPAPPVERLDLIDSRARILDLAVALRENRRIVEELRSKVREAIRDHFTVDDLL
jgi:hypothetical protein